MKIKLTLELLAWAAVVVLSLVALALVAVSTNQFSNTRVVYQGF